MWDEVNPTIPEKVPKFLAPANRIGGQSTLEVENDPKHLVWRRQLDRVRADRLERCECFPACVGFALQDLQAIGHGLRPVPLGDEVDQLGDLLFDLLDTRAEFPKLAALPACQLSEALGDPLARVRESLLRCQAVTQLLEEARSEDILADGECVDARASLRVVLAAVVRR